MSKLQPDFSLIGIGQPFIALILFALTWVFLGMSAGFVMIAAIFGVYALISLTYLRRTENLWYLAPFAMQTSFILFVLLNPKVGIFPVRVSSFSPLILLMIIMIIFMIYVLVTKRLKWRGMEVFELAARKVSEISNGFTERPKPLGKIDYTPTELSGFILFLKSNLIAWPVNEPDRVLLIPLSGNDSYRLPLGLSNDYSENTWIAFDKAGTVSVQISKKDYMKYKQALSFDSLVDSMGTLFIDYFEMYKRGEEKRIIYELNSIHSFPFS